MTNAPAVTTGIGGDLSPYSVETVRQDFPILSRQIGDFPLTYLDSANTSQKPTEVVNAVAAHYLEHNANVARAMYALGAEATAAYENARHVVATFIGAERADEVVFTKNATEALNIAAATLGSRLRPGDEVVTTVMEHHSNIVPWQLACERSGATLRWFDITDDGRLDLDAAAAAGLINERTKVVSLAWVANTVGSINPVAQIAAMAHEVGATVVVDGAQGVPQLPTRVSELGADMLAFTGHKMLGPTGVGVLWGRYDLLAELPPYAGGGEMVELVTMAATTYAAPPRRFEAGTPPIAQAVGLAAAIGYLSRLGMPQIAAHEREITGHLLEGLATIPGLRVLGPTDLLDRGGAVTFTLGDIHPHDVMQILDSRGIAVRGGQHCARPVHDRLSVHSSVRASSYVYTTRAEIERLIDALAYTREFFAGRMGS